MRRLYGRILIAALIWVCGQTAGGEAVAGEPMSSDAFWGIIEATAEREATPDRQLEALRKQLSGLSADEIVSFDMAFQRKMQRSYSWDLWGAAYVVHGGASDDGFEYFRRWLISKGKHVFETALHNPDDLADMLALNAGGMLEFEEFAYVAGDVWGEKNGKNPYAHDSEFFAERVTSGSGPSGVPFEEDGEHLAKRYPKLWKRFGNSPLGF